MEDELQIYNGSYSEKELKRQGLFIMVWADSQCLFDMPHYRQHCYLINDDYGLKRFGGSAYVVEKEWFNKNN